jgi:error-prone DNA polymerase
MPGSANDVMFITIEDETDNANLIVWPSVFERFRRTILSSTMFGCRGKVQSGSRVIHVVVEYLMDFSGELQRVGELDKAFRLPSGRGDEARRAGGPDPRETMAPVQKPRDMYVPDLRTDALRSRRGISGDIGHCWCKDPPDGLHMRGVFGDEW